MPKSYLMTWIPDSRRWTKFHRGKRYFISCRQLGVPETKEASWRAANAWWEQQEGLSELPTERDRVSRAMQVSRLVNDFGKMDDESRKEAVEALLGAGVYEKLESQRDAVLATMIAPAPERTIAAQVEGWKNLLRGICQSGQMSEGRFDAYCRNIKHFVEWIGPETSIDAIDEAKIEGFFNHLTGKVGEGVFSPTYAHTLLMTSKQFVSRIAELKLIAMPGNIRSRRFRFNHSVAATIETFTTEEIGKLLEAATQRTRLYILLMLNCGMYQNDIAELKTTEVNWTKGTLSRARSKTRERGGPVVTYKLWPETLVLLKEQRVEGILALATEDGNPLVKEWLEEGKYRRYDAIQSAWSRLAKKLGGAIRLGMKHLRKTSSSMLGEHPQFKYYTTYFLADSPKGMSDRHYTKPSDTEFFEALDWLRGKVLPSDWINPSE